VVPHCVRSGSSSDTQMPDDHPKTPFKSIRLRYLNYDEPGAYFVTLVAHERRCLFGSVSDGEVCLSASGEIVRLEWQRSAELRPRISFDAFVVMPNHFHAIVLFHTESPSARSAALRPITPRHRFERAPASLSSLIAGFKAATTRRIRAALQRPSLPVWQPRFYDHVIRNETDLAKIRAYIAGNPAEWRSDSENPDRVP
jgi:putative transposase